MLYFTFELDTEDLKALEDGIYTGWKDPGPLNH